MDLIWLIPALPLLGFVTLVFAGRRLGDPVAGWFAIGGQRDQQLTQVLHSCLRIRVVRQAPLDLDMLRFVKSIQHVVD